MSFALNELQWLLPEIFVLSMACIILVVDAYLKPELRATSYQLAQGTLLGSALLSYVLIPDTKLLLLHNMVVVDPLAGVLKVFVALISFVVFLYSRDYLKERDLFRGEYFVLGLFAVLGMQVMISAQHFLTIYLGLELLSLSLYAMVAMQRDSASATEAAMKYFVLGALASGMLLYGMSMLYGVTGSLELAVIADTISSGQIEPMLLSFGLVFIVVGLAFKLGAVPFHMWVPDVYQGAPTAITLFLGSAPKLAAFAMVMRLLVDGLQPLHPDWQGMLMILALLSIASGNVIAIAQTNIKRMLAYSTISHVGFLLFGILTAQKDGYVAAMFYTLVYTLMTLGAFGMILLLSRAGFESENLDDFKGLNQRNSWYAFLMLVVMLSMAGIPPMLGFWAKWAVLSQVVHAGFVWLALLAVLFSVIGAFYYLRVIKLMYFDKAADETPIEASVDMRVALSANGLLILSLGLFPEMLMVICVNAIS